MTQMEKHSITTSRHKPMRLLKTLLESLKKLVVQLTMCWTSLRSLSTWIEISKDTTKFGLKLWVRLDQLAQH